MPAPTMQAPEVTDWATESMNVPPPTLTGGSFMGGTAMAPQAPVTEDWSATTDDWSKQPAPQGQAQQSNQWGGETENWG